MYEVKNQEKVEYGEREIRLSKNSIISVRKPK